jgi:DNA-binding Lrp family transcriptional regulator
MDSLDVRIYREFFHSKTGPPLESDIHRSYRSMAKKIGIDEVTIRNRIKKLHQSGFLKGWHLVVNPSLVGVKWSQIWLNVRRPSDKDDLIGKLSSMSGVLTISDYYGSALTVIVMQEDDFSANKEFEVIAKISNAENLTRASIPFPRCSIELGQTDWRIVKAIQASPRQSYSVVSSKLGVSEKTVKRRLQRMIQEDVLFVLPSLNPRGLSGAMLTDLVVFYANPGSKTDVDNRIVSKFDKLLIRGFGAARLPLPRPRIH